MTSAAEYGRVMNPITKEKLMVKIASRMKFTGTFLATLWQHNMTISIAKAKMKAGMSAGQ